MAKNTQRRFGLMVRPSRTTFNAIQHPRARGVVVTLGIALLAFLTAAARAQDSTTSKISGIWDDPATWTNGVPTSVLGANGDVGANIATGTNVTLQSAGQTAPFVDVGAPGAAGTGTLTIAPGADLTISRSTSAVPNIPSMRIGPLGGNPGMVTMTGGNVLITGNNNGDIANGDLMVGDTNPGTMNMSGGTYTVSDEVYVGFGAGNTATFNMTGGMLSTQNGTGRNIVVGFFGNGTFNVGGDATVETSPATSIGIIVGLIPANAAPTATGTFTLADSATINVPSVFTNFFAGGVGTNATITQTGGTVNAGVSYVLGAQNGTTVMNHSGGTINVLFGNGDMVVSDGNANTSTYNVSGAAAVNLAHDFIVGTFNGSNGTVNQSGGAITVAHNFRIGADGVGAWNQSGGTTTGGSMFLGDFDNSFGTYRISGGSLTLTDLNVGAALASNAPPAPTGTQGQALDAHGTFIVSGSGGAITITGNLNANPAENSRTDGPDNTGTLIYEFLDPTGVSLTRVNGVADLNGAVIDIRELGYNLKPDDLFKLINAASISGNYSLAPEDVGHFELLVAPDPTLGGQSLEVRAVPEPTALVGLSLVTAASLLARRRQLSPTR